MSAIVVPDAHAGLLLLRDQLSKLVFGEAGEVAIQQVNAVLVQRLSHRLPGVGVIASDGFTCEFFNRARPHIVWVQVHLGCFAGRMDLLLQEREAHDHKPCGEQKDETAKYCDSEFSHRAPPRLSSFPFTTPDATEMRAGPETAISTCATPRLIGASTVVFPLASVLVKLTTVPSGTKLPLQSRTGSVSTAIPFGPGTALILRLQASEATC